ncbi:hypothetical protein [Spirosoma areae]
MLKLRIETQLTPKHLGVDLAPTEARYLPVFPAPEVPDTFGDYEKALDLARAVNLNDCPRMYARLSGRFIFGDLIEALFTTYNIHTERLIISTYSYSQNNVDSLRTLLDGGFVDSIDLLVSDQFYTHENRPGKLIPYTYQELDRDNRFQLGACGTHDKLTFFKTDGGKFICMHGSANFRSSGSMEHVMIENSEALYTFVVPGIDRLIKYFKTINKSARHSNLWQTVQAPTNP